MVPIRYRSFILLLLAGLAWMGLPARAPACPFCTQRGPTFLQDFDQASMVLFGKFTNPHLPKENEFTGGTTDSAIAKVIKPNKTLGDRKAITLVRYVPKTKTKYLIFCDIYKGKIDPFRGVEVQKGGDIVKYLQGTLKVRDKSVPARLKYCFDYLDSPELEISL